MPFKRTFWSFAGGGLAVLLVLGTVQSRPLQAQEKKVGRFMDAFDDEELVGLFAAGEAYDATHTPEEFLRNNPVLRDLIPRPKFRLKRPSVVVSLNGLTCRLYDESSSFEKVYPVGVGVREAENSESITPTGDFRTHPDRSNIWFYTWERWVPSYFGGLPFLRLNIKSVENNLETYGLHGPIKQPLKRGYVSHGCVRMQGEDVREIFTAIYHAAPGAPVRIQKATDYNRYGLRYDLDYPRVHFPVDREPPVKIDGSSDVQVVLDLPKQIQAGRSVEISSKVQGTDAGRVAFVLYNEDARWDKNLSGPVSPKGYTMRHIFTSPGPKQIYAIALDVNHSPIAYASHEIEVQAQTGSR